MEDRILSAEEYAAYEAWCRSVGAFSPRMCRRIFADWLRRRYPDHPEYNPENYDTIPPEVQDRYFKDDPRYDGTNLDWVYEDVPARPNGERDWPAHIGQWPNA